MQIVLIITTDCVLFFGGKPQKIRTAVINKIDNIDRDSTIGCSTKLTIDCTQSPLLLGKPYPGKLLDDVSFGDNSLESRDILLDSLGIPQENLIFK
jgi:hypothetical protein